MNNKIVSTKSDCIYYNFGGDGGGVGKSTLLLQLAAMLALSTKTNKHEQEVPLVVTVISWDTDQKGLESKIYEAAQYFKSQDVGFIEIATDSALHPIPSTFPNIDSDEKSLVYALQIERYTPSGLKRGIINIVPNSGKEFLNDDSYKVGSILAKPDLTEKQKAAIEKMLKRKKEGSSIDELVKYLYPKISGLSELKIKQYLLNKRIREILNEIVAKSDYVLFDNKPGNSKHFQETAEYADHTFIISKKGRSIDRNVGIKMFTQTLFYYLKQLMEKNKNKLENRGDDSDDFKNLVVLAINKLTFIINMVRNLSQHDCENLKNDYVQMIHKLIDISPVNYFTSEQIKIIKDVVGIKYREKSLLGDSTKYTYDDSFLRLFVVNDSDCIEYVEDIKESQSNFPWYLYPINKLSEKFNSKSIAVFKEARTQVYKIIASLFSENESYRQGNNFYVKERKKDNTLLAKVISSMFRQ